MITKNKLHLLLLLCIIAFHLCSEVCSVKMEEFERGYIPTDSIYFFQHPVITTDGDEIEISSIIDPDKDENYIVCIATPEC